jgi:hypothetical protein
MNRKFQLLTAAMWLTLPLFALRNWRVWDRLPARMASHFDASGHANGWMSRETSLTFSLAFMAFMLTVFSVVLWAAQRKTSVGTFSWTLLAFFYLQIGSISLLLNQVLNFNLDGTPLNPMSLFITTPISILVLLVVYLGSHRGQATHPGSLVAEEVHAGKALSLIALLPMAALFWGMGTLALSPARIPLGIVSLLALVACIMAWSGFHYRFTSSGVEIRTLGFRLRTIPVEQIREYAADSWSVARGYGIRGLGNKRAYVWGSHGVRIRTTDGEVFLGHSDPERIIRDLDAIRNMPHEKSFERQAAL